MSKNIENKLKRIIENSDPQQLEDNLVNYTMEALYEAAKGNKDGIVKFNTALKFFQDHNHLNPNAFARAAKKISHHLFTINANCLDESISAIHELKLNINFLAINDLVYLNHITELINTYSSEKKRRIIS